MSSQLIIDKTIVADEWTIIELPHVEQKTKKQAGKVVLFKLTGEDSPTKQQIDTTNFPSTGKILLPLKVFLLHKKNLKQRLDKQEIGIWLSTHEEMNKLIDQIGDLNQFPLIAVYIEKFADGRIFSIGTQLRIKYQYKNYLRAFGDVLRDQIYFLKRSGYNSYLIRNDRDAKDALKGLDDFTDSYQGAVDIKEPIWRRLKR